MADLMKATTSMSSLISKYNNFAVPAKKLHIDGKEISSQGGAVENITVTLSVDSASSVSFSVYEVYDVKERQFNSKLKGLLKLGAIVKLELGYGSDTQPVFHGFIGELSYELGDYPSINVSAFDMRRLMMEGKSRTINYTEKSYSSVFEQVMSRYSKISSEKDVDKTEDLKDQAINQNASDYDFVVNTLCRNAGREFFVCADKVYFKKLKTFTAPILTFEWGRDLLSFSRSAKYQDTKVKVVGYDDEKKEAVEADVKAKATDAQKSLTDAQRTEIEPEANTKEEAQKIADYLLNQELGRARQGSGSCLGLPEIVPGRYIKVAKADSAIDGKYYLKQVTHNFGSGGFTTNFQVGGW